MRSFSIKIILQKCVTYGLYPFILISQLTVFSLAVTYGWELKRVFGFVAPAQFALLIAVEFLFPIKQEWKMTLKSFYRDLKYFATGFLTINGLKLVIGYLAISSSEKNAQAVKQIPFVVEFICILLVFEFFQYWFHRLSHEAGGSAGAFLWRIHSIHHLPDKVYLLMHPVMHPLGSIVTSILLQSILIIAGADPRSLYLLNIFMSLQGAISHYNVDVRTGFLNYLFTGTELHRYHHSADVGEAKNYGQITPLFDLVFGTFYYRPGTSPASLGVADPDEYPASNKILQVLIFPFKRKGAPERTEIITEALAAGD